MAPTNSLLKKCISVFFCTCCSPIMNLDIVGYSIPNSVYSCLSAASVWVFVHSWKLNTSHPTRVLYSNKSLKQISFKISANQNRFKNVPTTAANVRLNLCIRRLRFVVPALSWLVVSCPWVKLSQLVGWCWVGDVESAVLSRRGSNISSWKKKNRPNFLPIQK